MPKLNPPFRSDQVGSLLRPPSVLDARRRFAAGEITAEQRRAVEDTAIADAVKQVESLGLRGVTDGEYRRAWFHLDFLEQLDGVTVSGNIESSSDSSRTVGMTPPRLTVTGRLRHTKDIQVADFAYLSSLVTATPKVTIPSPTMVHFRGGRAAIDIEAYPDLDEFFEDLAQCYRDEIAALYRAGSRYIQLDDTNLAYLCDPKMRDGARERGDDPDELPRTYAALINSVIDGRPDDLTVAIHLCRGNFRSTWFVEGGYEPVAEVLFNELHVDAYFLEYDDERSGDFSPLRFVPDDKTVVLGLVTTKVPTLEEPSELIRRVEAAGRYLPVDHMCLSPQCGFSSTVEGNAITEDDQWAKLALVVDTAADIWADAVAAVMRTQVGIVGAGPAGLLLSHLLHRRGIDSVVLEIRSRDYVEHRVRAGVLEQATVDTLCAEGVGERLRREGMVHTGIELRFGGRSHRIPFDELVPGRAITVYGQQEVVKDLIAARLAAGGLICFDVSDVALHHVDTDHPAIMYTADGSARRLDCDVIAGCDGFHGVSRGALPVGLLDAYEHDYPFAWLGILAAVAPSADELVYAQHERGFVLHSMRSAEISRFYLQVGADEDLAEWSDERIWSELRARLETVPGWHLAEGPVLEKGITAMRSFVAEPMQFGRLFLAGDAAHIVPATGAKGLNLAAADVCLLSDALSVWYANGSTEMLDRYSDTCLRRVWRAQHFSSWMTSLLHNLDTDDAFSRRLQRSYLEYVTSSPAAATSLAENYVGLEASRLGEAP